LVNNDDYLKKGNAMEKQQWVVPKLEELSVDKTLGGPFTNFLESDFGEPGHVPLGADFS
jgi:hypothetical protein